MGSVRKAGGRGKPIVSLPSEAAAGGPNDPAELVRVCARLAEDKKAEQIVILDLRGLMYVTDFFLIASGANARQLQAIRIAIHEGMARCGARPIGVEGAGQNRWVLMDYGDFVVHLFDPEWRKLYDLELLWGDAPRVEWQVPRRRLRRSEPRLSEWGTEEAPALRSSSASAFVPRCGTSADKPVEESAGGEELAQAGEEEQGGAAARDRRGGRRPAPRRRAKKENRDGDSVR